ncbi:MAG: hypothetical protein K8S54_15660 [Spirochaetia bacterium]|nr:hypothetical protein [Spirochaetia bacterium]
MRIHLTSFAISMTTLCSLIILVLTIWTRLSSTFGGEFMSAFQSIHPNPYGAGDTDLTLLQSVLGALFDLFYAATDSLLFSLGFGSLYNFLVRRAEKRIPE